MLKTQHPKGHGRTRTAQLRVFGTTDLHVHLLPYDYFSDRPAEHLGLAQTAALLEVMRGEVANSVLLDNGDFLQGTPLSDVIAFEKGFGPGDLHPVIDAMNTVGFDASTLGNHEFNYGLPFLEAVLDRARFPVVSANILTKRADTPEGDITYRPASAILTRQIEMDDGGPARTLALGVIGFAPPQTSSWDRQHLEGRIQTRDIVEAAKGHVPRLKAAGADIIIALCHSGIGAQDHIDGMENAAVPLAAVDGIDALVVGHTHQVFPNAAPPIGPTVDPERGTIHGKPAVQPGHFGSHLGVIDLGLGLDADGWVITDHTVRAEPVAIRATPQSVPQARVAPDARVIETASAAHEDTLSFLRKPLGQFAGPLNSYFVLATPNPTIRLVADAQRRFASGLLAGGPHKDRPLISAVAPFKAGGRAGPDSYVDIPPGPVAIRHAAELYLFPNTLCVLDVTGVQICDWLERSAGMFHQISPGSRDQRLLDPDFFCYNFDILDGLTYRFDLSQPSRYTAEGALVDPGNSRVREVGLGGRPIQADQSYLVVTNSYRAGGGGMFRAPSEATPVVSTALTARDILIDHIRNSGLIRPDIRTSWEFVPMPGTCAIFESGPGALNYMPPNFSHLGSDETGFERFEMAL